MIFKVLSDRGMVLMRAESKRKAYTRAEHLWGIARTYLITVATDDDVAWAKAFGGGTEGFKREIPLSEVVI